MKIEFVKLHPDARTPRNAYGNDAGWDLFVLEDTPIHWSPNHPITDVRTGIAVSIPDGYYGRIIHRSSTPRKKKLQVMEGIIDAGFRGELFAGVSPLVEPSFMVEAGESLAQLIIQKVEPVEWVLVTRLTESARGEKGFGSSGR
jgi:deoxyuridine 5'-triphosphate nucleotidohydrolase